jgi:carboxypeptidase C (cathepsin A)
MTGKLLAALVLLSFLSAPVHAQDALIERKAPTGAVLSLLPAPAVTQHTVEAGGGTIRYNAVAGTLSLLGGDGAVTAEIFYTYYSIVPDGAQDRAASRPRPITFLFNGGPGAASAYLNLGGIGPRTIAAGADGGFLPPPQRLADNPDTWLAFTDLVFVDPVGTGYSREAPGQKPEEFWSVERDASSVGAFVRLFLQKTGRENSPLFLAGESYGGFRAALLARTLQEDIGLAPSGVVMISPALDFSVTRADDLNPLKWALTLPSMAAVELAREGVHGPALAERLAAAERFALSDYLVALARGREASRRTAAAVAEMTGLPMDLVARYDGRVPIDVFAKETGRAGGVAPSIYDATLSAPDTAPEATRGGGPDAVLDRSVPALTSAFVAYVRDELGFRTDVSYRLLNGEIARRWDYGTSPSRQGYAGVLGDLQKARALNPSLRILVAHGYTDLVTPYFATRYLLSQLPELSGAESVEQRVYEGGHMLYLRPASRAALARDVQTLVFAPNRFQPPQD